jgi:copper(I)-binding protein
LAKNPHAAFRGGHSEFSTMTTQSTFLRGSFFSALLALFLAFTASAAVADDITVGTLTISSPWARATPPGAKAAGGYVTIHNSGTQSDRLIAVSMEIAGRAEVHEMKMDNGVAQMRELEDGLEIPAGGTVELKPGSFHLMLMDLAGPLKEGDSIVGTLTFEKAGTVDLTFDVGPIGSSEPPMHDHGAMGD